MFSLLFLNVLPLYAIIAFGFVMGRYFCADTKTLANILLYGLVPVVMFGSAVNMELEADYIFPPLMIGSLCVVVSMITYMLGKRLRLGDHKANSLGMMAVSCNATYFGIPIALVLGGVEWFGLFMIMVLPLFIADALLCPYYCARSQYNVKDSIVRVFRLPIIYGALGGVLYNIAGGSVTPIMEKYWEWFTGAVVVFGMMIIGVALGRIGKFKFDWSAFGVAVFSRYILWPGLGLLYIVADILWWGMFEPHIHRFILLICSCPIAANSVAYATKFHLNTEMTATMVALTTVLALLFIPGIFWITGL